MAVGRLRENGGMLYGREAELQVVADLVGGLAEGVGGALVVSGEAGIGKTALFAAAADAAGAAGVRVLWATGVEAEARLPFAGLHQVLRPFLPLAEQLPTRQREALLSAFGMSDAEPAGAFLIGLATLQLISDAAASAPVLVIADDAQWLDEPSCAVLAFVARRLAEEPVAVLVAVREGVASPFDAAGLPGLRLAGLPETAAAALLDAGAPGLEPPLRGRLLAAAAGNPLALVELPKALRSRPSAGRRLPGSPLPLTGRLEHAFAAQESALPDAARAVLLTAAADDEGALPEVLAAASALAGTEVTADALLPIVAAGLAEIRETGLRFRHPLVRSAIYQAASPARRRAAHTALAALLDKHPDRRAWHQAAAALGPDEQVAADLESAAFRAARRGAVSMAVDALRRAAQISVDSASRGRRLMLAADIAFSAGLPGLGHDLLGAAESQELTADERTHASWFREAYGGGWSGAAKIDSFVGLAEQMRAAGQTDAASSVLDNIALRCYWGNPGRQTRSAVIAAAERLPVAGSDPALLMVLASADPVRRGAVVNARIERIPLNHADPAGMHLTGIAAGTVWAWDRALPFLDVAVHGLREQGRLGLLVQTLATQAWAAAHLARPPAVLAAADEAARLAVETGQGHWVHAARLAEAVVASARGDDDAADALTRQAEAAYLAMGALPMLGLVQFARGRGAIVNQRYAEGLAHLRRILDPADPAHHPYVGTWGLADLVEAAVQGSDLDAARAYLDQLESLAATTSGPLLLAAAAYARPLVAAEADASGNEVVEQLYLAALAEGLTNWPGYRARMLLSYGGWLRRQRRAAESRVPLREARDSFDALGFGSLAERARMELRAAGESSSRREARPWDELTAQELQIARMAADGLSNREIGDQLYVSHRTVSAHLYRIFPKLGITSRSQLHAAIS
jgi:DNA-binding CsgD family transcriptional regulator